MEASAIPASVSLARTRLALGAPLLRIRPDEQLVSLFRSGSEEAFRAIHDRYRQRMFAYTRQMLSGSAVDAEDAVQEIFVRAYSGLRASNRELALRAWLYRIAHNRCIDELRRPQSVATEAIPVSAANAGGDPVVRLEQRDTLQRLIADVQRLPDQQRSALLMRELAGMTYADVAGALGVSVPAVKSLLVRARVGLAQASEARDTACARIREELIVAHDRGVRASGLARRHLRDCPQCRAFRGEVRGVSRQLAAFVPALGPIGVIAKLLGAGGASGGGAAAGGSAIAGSGAAAAASATAGGVAGTGAVATFGAIAGSGHVVTLLAAAAITAGGAIELQHIAPPAPHRVHHHRPVAAAAGRPSHSGGAPLASAPAAATGTAQAAAPAGPSTATAAGTGSSADPFAVAGATTGTARRHRASTKNPVLGLPISETMDPDHWDSLYGVTPLVNPPSPTATASPTTTPAPATGGSSPTSTAGTSPTSTQGTAPVGSTVGTAPTSATGTAPVGTTGTATGSTSSSSAGSTSGATGTSSATGTPSAGGSSTATGTSGSATATSGSPRPVGGTRRSATVTPASTGSIDAAKLAAAAKHHGHGTIAVFTMTGN